MAPCQDRPLFFRGDIVLLAVRCREPFTDPIPNPAPPIASPSSISGPVPTSRCCRLPFFLQLAFPQLRCVVAWSKAAMEFRHGEGSRCGKQDRRVLDEIWSQGYPKLVSFFLVIVCFTALRHLGLMSCSWHVSQQQMSRKWFNLCCEGEKR